jgi:hypothetical protein
MCCKVLQSFEHPGSHTGNCSCTSLMRRPVQSLLLIERCAACSVQERQERRLAGTLTHSSSGNTAMASTSIARCSQLSADASGSPPFAVASLLPATCRAEYDGCISRSGWQGPLVEAGKCSRKKAYLGAEARVKAAEGERQEVHRLQHPLPVAQIPAKAPALSAYTVCLLSVGAILAGLEAWHGMVSAAALQDTECTNIRTVE